MKRDEPIENVTDLFNAMLKGINPIYVVSKLYMKRRKNPEKQEYQTLLAETIQIAYAYGCNFVEVKEVK